MVKNPPAVPETWVQSLGWEDPLEEGMATHPSFLAWRIPWTEEPGGLQSMGSQRVGHDWTTKHSTALIHCMHTPQFIYPCIHRWTHGLSHLWLLWIILLWTWVWIYFLELLVSVLSVPRSEITRSYGSSVFFAEFLRNYYTVSIAVAVCFNSHQQCTTVPHPHQHLLFIYVFLM